jgi:hypothetical protein
MGRWITRRPWFLTIGIVLIVFDVAGLSPAQPVLLVGGVASTIYGIFDIVNKTVQDFRALRQIYDRPLGATPLDKPYEYPYDSWQPLELRGMRAVIDPVINERLFGNARISADRNEEVWRPAGDCENLRTLMRLRLDMDERKIRLSSDLFADTDSVVLQRTSYSAFIVTNRIGSVELRKRGVTRPLVDVEEVLLNGGRIPQLKRSKCSNHLGVDVLAVTDDGRVLITRQGQGTEISQKLLASSGSGSVDWADYHQGDDLNTVLRRAMAREMCEELGLSRPLTPSPDSIMLLGYARLSNLAGKPQFFGVVRMRSVAQKVSAAERRYIDDHLNIWFDPGRGVPDLLEALASFEAKHRFELSFPLYLNLRFFQQWLTSSPAAVNWLGQGSSGPTH